VPTYISTTGEERLEAELAELRDVQRPAVVARIKAARELGDLRENADYDAARREQSFIEGRVQAIEAILRTAHVVDEATTHEVIIGSVVTLERGGETVEYTIVGSSEANPTLGRVSYLSPLGKALLGRRAGDDVIVQAPSGERHYRIADVR
jgi:transcription elongation factor GreA